MENIWLCCICSKCSLYHVNIVFFVCLYFSILSLYDGNDRLHLNFLLAQSSLYCHIAGQEKQQGDTPSAQWEKTSNCAILSYFLMFILCDVDYEICSVTYSESYLFIFLLWISHRKHHVKISSCKSIFLQCKLTWSIFVCSCDKGY